MLMLPMLLVPLVAPAAPVHGAQLDVSDSVVVNGLAVSVAEDGSHVGVTARVEAQAIRGGEGRVFVETKPLAQTDMQGSARLAARVAADILGLHWGDYDFLVVFHSSSTVIGGPSAGAVMTLALTSALWNLEHPDDRWTPDPRLAATGTINPDGTVGPVGGVPAKAAGAAKAGYTKVLYPAGQEQSVATGVGGQQSIVSMDEHCVELGISCRPVATVSDLIEAAVGVRVERPDADVPSTRDFAAELAPGVEVLVEDLASGLERAQQELDGVETDDARRQALQARIDVATQRLEDARRELEDESYYLAATSSFRGSIEATAAFWLARLADNGADRLGVDAAMQACEDAVDAASDVPTRADDWNQLFGVAAARVRIAEAEDLLSQARQRADGARTVADWEASVFLSAFCIERAGTVTWWAGLPDAFGAGPQVDDLDEVVSVTLDQAREAVTYATAVLGTSGGGEERLQVAEAAQEAGNSALALLAAVQAQVRSAVALQTGSGLDVPTAVLDAAEQGAARAVARARLAGAEPVLPVSLIELSSGQESDMALESLWLARGLALLVVTDLPSSQTASISGSPFRFVPLEWLVVAAGLGLLLGAGVVGVVWGATHRPTPRRPPGADPGEASVVQKPSPAPDWTGRGPPKEDERSADRIGPHRVEYVWDDGPGKDL